MSNLEMKLRAEAGTKINEVCRDAQRVADILGISVYFEFNGIGLSATQKTTPHILVDRYFEWSKDRREQKDN